MLLVVLSEVGLMLVVVLFNWVDYVGDNDKYVVGGIGVVMLVIMINMLVGLLGLG